MLESMERLEKALSQIRSVSSKLSKVFFAVLLLMCAASALFVMFGIMSFVENPLFDFARSVSLVPIVKIVISLLVYASSLYTASSMLHQISLGRSPFSFRYAKLIAVVGCLFAFDAVISFMMSPGFAMVFHFDGIDLGYISSQATEYPVFSIDVKSVFISVISFALSIVWRYGALLQEETDGLF